jgi:hypothetical protein
MIVAPCPVFPRLSGAKGRKHRFRAGDSGEIGFGHDRCPSAARGSCRKHYSPMNRSSLALLILLVVIASAHGQSVARAKQLSTDDSLMSESKIGTAFNDERILAARSIAALKRLEEDVLVYRSLGDFEANGRLARVSFETFQNDLREVTAEVEPMLARLSPGRLKTEISNALDSYSDGAFWWRKIDQPRVVHVSALTSTEYDRTPSDAAFLSTVPYTVAIHWRQAGKYLKHAEEIQNRDR